MLIGRGPVRASRSNAQTKRGPAPDVGTRLHRRIQQALGHASHGVILEPVEERFARQPLSGPASTSSPRGRGPADDPRHERLGRLAVEPLDLDRKHLDCRHLRVEELHHPREGIGNDVRHEQQTQTLRREVRGDALPEPVHIGVSIRWQQGRELGFRIAASRVGLVLERTV